MEASKDTSKSHQINKSQKALIEAVKNKNYTKLIHSFFYN